MLSKLTRTRIALFAILAVLALPAAVRASISTAQKHVLKQEIQNSGSAVDTIVDSANYYYLTEDIADISAEATYYQAIPYAGTVSKIYSIMDGTLGGDGTITCAIGGTGITNGVLTLSTSDDAAGVMDSATPTAANTVTAGGELHCAVTGFGSGGTPRVHLVFQITR